MVDMITNGGICTCFLQIPFEIYLCSFVDTSKSLCYIVPQRSTAYANILKLCSDHCMSRKYGEVGPYGEDQIFYNYIDLDEREGDGKEESVKDDQKNVKKDENLAIPTNGNPSSEVRKPVDSKKSGKIKKGADNLLFSSFTVISYLNIFIYRKSGSTIVEFFEKISTASAWEICRNRVHFHRSTLRLLSNNRRCNRKRHNMGNGGIQRPCTESFSKSF